MGGEQLAPLKRCFRLLDVPLRVFHIDVRLLARTQLIAAEATPNRVLEADRHEECPHRLPHDFLDRRTPGAHAYLAATRVDLGTI